MARFGAFGVGTLLLATVLAGCGSSGSGKTIAVANGLNASKACLGTPKHGGNLVYAQSGETVTLNPMTALTNYDLFVDELIYSPLVRNDPSGQTKIVPALAQSWEVSSNGKEYTFHLKPGIKFSNGRPVTAEDVVFSLNRFGNPKINKTLAVLTVGYGAAEVVNSATVRVKLTKPVAAFLYNIAIYPAFIVPKANVEREGNAFWKHPFGAGPFRLKEWEKGSHITLERSQYFWEPGQPYLNTVRYNFAAETNSRILSLRSGQVQIADGVPYSQLESLESDPQVAVQKVPVPANYFLSMNTSKPQFKDQNVRLAMEYALNRAQMNSEILHGVGTVPNSILPQFSLDAPPSEVPQIEYNLTKAKEYMAKSKYPHGFSTTLIYPTGFEYYKQMTLLMQQELAAIGINIKLVEEDQTAAVEHFYEGEYELVLPYYVGSSDVPVPDEYAGLYALPASETNGNYTYWSNHQAEQSYLKMSSDLNETSRRHDWAVLQREFLEQSPILNILDTPLIYAHQKSVCGTYANGLGADQMQLTWLSGGSGN
jgi:peptide/nickel transport system substrate-binding protein